MPTAEADLNAINVAAGTCRVLSAKQRIIV